MASEALRQLAASDDPHHRLRTAYCNFRESQVRVSFAASITIISLRASDITLMRDVFDFRSPLGILGSHR